MVKRLFNYNILLLYQSYNAKEPKHELVIHTQDARAVATAHDRSEKEITVKL